MHIVEHVGAPETELDQKASGITMTMFEERAPLCATLWSRKRLSI